MSLVLFLFRMSKKMMLLATLCGIIAGVSAVALIAIINARLVSGTLTNHAFLPAFAILCVMVLVAKLCSQIILVTLSQNAIAQLRMRLSEQILSTSLSTVEQLGSSRLFASLSDDVMNISTAVPGVPVVCTNCAVILALLVYLFWTSLILLPIILCFLLVGITTYLYLSSTGWRYLAAARVEQNTLFKHLDSLTRGLKELKLSRMRREGFMNNSLKASLERFRRNSVKGLTIYSGSATWGQLLYFISIGLLLYAVPQFVHVTRRALISYTIAILYMQSPLEGILVWRPMLRRASVALEAIRSIDLTGELVPSSALQPPKKNWDSLEVEGLRYSYSGNDGDREFIMGPIDLCIRPGECVFIVGGNGSGKTTLVKLITGLYTPHGGSIRLDGVEVTVDNREWYREHFAAVFSDFHLFGLPNNKGDGEEASVINRLLAKLDLSERFRSSMGVTELSKLSRGQLKRLSLVDVYMEERPICIFDEWAADQDPVFKEVFYRQLIPELQASGRTVIAVTHDDRYFECANRVMVLENGMPREQTRREARTQLIRE